VTTRLRAAGVADIPAILRLWHDAGHRPSVTDTPDALAALLAAPNARLIVAVRPDAIAGTALVGFDGWRANVYRLVTAAGEPDRDLRLALIQAVLDWAASRGLSRVAAFLDGAPATHALWQAAGFRPDPQTHRFTCDLEDLDD
jgi:hypothetical protein